MTFQGNEEGVAPNPNEYHRTEVHRRARALRRRRRALGSGIGSVAVAGGVVALALTIGTSGEMPTGSALASPTGNAPHLPSASSTTPSVPTSPTTTSTPRASTPITPPSTSTPLGGGTTPSTPVTTPTTGGSTSGGGASGGQNATQTYNELPSGTSQPLFEHNIGVINLAAPPLGSWGTAVVTSGNAVLSIWHQSTNSDNSVQVQVQSYGEGTATLLIPNSGDPSGAWTITFVVNGTTGCEQNGVFC